MRIQSSLLGSCIVSGDCCIMLSSLQHCPNAHQLIPRGLLRTHLAGPEGFLLLFPNRAFVLTRKVFLVALLNPLILQDHPSVIPYNLTCNQKNIQTLKLFSGYFQLPMHSGPQHHEAYFYLKQTLKSASSHICQVDTPTIYRLPFLNDKRSCKKLLASVSISTI